MSAGVCGGQRGVEVLLRCRPCGHDPWYSSSSGSSQAAAGVAGRAALVWAWWEWCTWLTQQPLIPSCQPLGVVPLSHPALFVVGCLGGGRGQQPDSALPDSVQECCVWL